jgi:hypothetical protein
MVCLSVCLPVPQVAASGGQLSIVKGLYSSLLSELQSAAAAAGSQQAQLTTLQAENERLRQQLVQGWGHNQGRQVDAGGSSSQKRAHDLL